MNIADIKRILVDARNWDTIKDSIIAEMTAASLIGVDLETHDNDRHEGLNRLMKVGDDGKKSSTTKLVFDTNRTTITGFSLYADGTTNAYYINLNHADVENRLPWPSAVQLLDAIDPAKTYKIAHNAPFELTMLRKSLGYDLGKNLIDSMQLAVTAFNDDTYDIEDFQTPDLGGITRLFGSVSREFAAFQPGTALTSEQSELLYKVVAKESDAEHSYNGLIKPLTYTYGLKKLSQKFLGYTQKTFEETLNGKAHMGEITGEEACYYGADDAIVCVFLYHKLMSYLLRNNPEVVPTFFSQENPMAQVYSKVWGNGVRIDLDKVRQRQAVERSRVCATLRSMKAMVKALLPFPEDIHEKLVKYDPKAYGKPGTAEKYRKGVADWANSPDCEEDFDQLYQVKSALSKQWAEERGIKESKGMSINYYQVIRCILLDLCRCSFQLADGKVQSDGEARRVMEERWIKKNVDAGIALWSKKEGSSEPGKYIMAGDNDEAFEHFRNVLGVLNSYKQLAESEQVIKLFITNYLNLTDPETGRVYPSLSSRLNSRRMALATPNLSQLPKFGGSAYVRSFFLPDKPNHVLVSMDWSGIELVLIGEESGDKEFLEVFGSLPHGDLHTKTASGLLEMSVPDFKQLPDAKQKRNEIGKPANFGYWYSGGLGTVAKELGLSSEVMWDFVDKYRTTYAGAEAWRLDTIRFARDNGYVQLPDKHMRLRFESTPQWANVMRHKFGQCGQTVQKFGELVIKKIQTRSGNQAVNSKIQGGSATLAKRSILKQEDVIIEKGYDAVLKFPVHDELVYSVDRTQTFDFLGDLWTTMCTHPDIVKRVKLDAAGAVGMNYQAYHPVTNPKGQIELSELSKLPFIPEDRWGKKATREEVDLILAYLFDELKVPEEVS